MRKRLKSTILWTTITCFTLVGCENSLSPTAATDTDSVPEHGLVGGLIGGVLDQVDEVINILQQSPAAPPLETYGFTFWAVQGQAKTVEVDYLPVADLDAEPFLKLDFPAGALLEDQHGNPIAPGDSVLIEVTIDDTDLKVRLLPHGIEFAEESPVTLRMYYHNANLDLTGDGLVSWIDRRILRESLGMYYQPEAGVAWSALASENSIVNQYIEAPLEHFSNYAVAW